MSPRLLGLRVVLLRVLIPQAVLALKGSDLGFKELGLGVQVRKPSPPVAVSVAVAVVARCRPLPLPLPPVAVLCGVHAGDHFVCLGLDLGLGSLGLRLLGLGFGLFGLGFCIVF